MAGIIVGIFIFGILSLCALVIFKRQQRWDDPYDDIELPGDSEVLHVCGEIRDCRDTVECSTCDEAERLQALAYDLQDEIWEERKRAGDLFPRFPTIHHGFEVLHEEFDELKAEVRSNPEKYPGQPERMRKEAIQVAAMALRFLTDCCEHKERNQV